MLDAITEQVIEDLLLAVEMQGKALETQPSSIAEAQNTAKNLVAEALDGVKAMLARDDRGWDLYQGGAGRDEEDGGPTLDFLKMWSKRLRESTVGAPWLKRGGILRTSFILQGGMQLGGIDEALPEPAKMGRPRKEEKAATKKTVRDIVNDPENQRLFFGKTAMRKRELSLYTDGICVWFGDDKTKRLRRIPLAEITHILRDPDDASIIWAYRREWKHRNEDFTTETKAVWVFTDFAKAHEVDSVVHHITGDSTQNETVDRSLTAFDMHANPFDGWALGVPDALPAWIWNGIARDAYMDGVTVTKAMARIIAKQVSGSAKGAKNAQVQLATAAPAGSTAVMANGSDYQTLNSAGHGYNFTTLRELVALIATALSVSVIDLTSNPGDAGSSYGSANALVPSIRLAMQERRDEHTDLNKRVLRWMGARDPQAWFLPLVDGSEQYRQLQAITLPFLQGIMSLEDYMHQVASVMGIPDFEIPDGAMLPNNINSIARKDVDDHGGNVETPAPGQGKSSGLGDDTTAPRDLRDEK